MTENNPLTEEVRSVKQEAIGEATDSITKLLVDLEKSEKNQPTRRKAVEDARRAVRDSARPYLSQKQIDEFNAMNKAAQDGGSSRGAAFGSADMKPGKS
ncbi:hypothetical protein [Glutamicibacter sp.]|uniref:hypothetical protein n=1 Tax=Glutamicibacter sp. TaxID=1931995 RepID=UPI003D6A089D